MTNDQSTDDIFDADDLSKVTRDQKIRACQKAFMRAAQRLQGVAENLPPFDDFAAGVMPDAVEGAIADAQRGLRFLKNILANDA